MLSLLGSKRGLLPLKSLGLGSSPHSIVAETLDGSVRLCWQSCWQLPTGNLYQSGDNILAGFKKVGKLRFTSLHFCRETESHFDNLYTGSHHLTSAIFLSTSWLIWPVSFWAIMASSFSVSDSEDSMSQGDAGNVKFQRKFSVADYTELLGKASSSTTKTETASTPAPSKSASSSHPTAPAKLFKFFTFRLRKHLVIFLC